MRLRLALLGALVFALPAPAARAGDVAGSVSLAVVGARLADVGPVAVYLAPLGGVPVKDGSRRAEIRQHGARFVPDFLVVAPGEAVAMPNDDTIFHNVFSRSRPNDFDLGVYPAGQTKTVRLRHPGTVKIYCSIHESMNGTLLVAPSPWFTLASASGAFRIGDVPPGDYELTAWNERLPVVKRRVSVSDGTLRVDLTLGAPGS